MTLSKHIDDTGFVVSAAIIVPQIVVAACSPWAGRLAQRIGRKPILLFGFAALPLRGLLFALTRTPFRWWRSRCWTASARRCSA